MRTIYEYHIHRKFHSIRLFTDRSKSVWQMRCYKLQENVIVATQLNYMLYQLIEHRRNPYNYFCYVKEKFNTINQEHTTKANITLYYTPQTNVNHIKNNRTTFHGF